jgi:hypothetical protein
MEEMKHTVEDFIKSLYTVSSRRTSLKFAEDVLTEAINDLESQFSLFKNIEIKKTALMGGGIQVTFTDDFSRLHTMEIARAIESLVRVVYDDLSDESGLYFITEIKNHLKKDSIRKINDLGVDLEKIQSEQHFAFNRRKRKKEKQQEGVKENPLGYTWGSVSKWNYNPESKQVELFDKEGNQLDKIDLQHAMRRYVENLSGITETSPMDLASLLEEHEKSYSFLKLIHQENVDFDTAKRMLNLSDDEINKIINDLVKMKFLQYVTDDEVEITESGKEFIAK